jgi:hypothetical protein
MLAEIHPWLESYHNLQHKLVPDGDRHRMEDSMTYQGTARQYAVEKWRARRAAIAVYAPNVATSNQDILGTHMQQVFSNAAIQGPNRTDAAQAEHPH